MKNYFNKDEAVNTNFLRRTARYHTLKQLNLKMAFEGLGDINNKDPILRFEENEPTNTKKGVSGFSRYSQKKLATMNDDKTKAPKATTNNENKGILKNYNNLRNSVRTKSRTNTSLPFVALNLNDKNTKPFERTVKINDNNKKPNDKITKTIYSNSGSRSTTNFLEKSAGPLRLKREREREQNIAKKTSAANPPFSHTVSAPVKNTIIHSTSGRLYNLGKKKEEDNNQTRKNNFSKYESRVSDSKFGYKVNDRDRSKSKIFEDRREGRRRSIGLKRKVTKEYEEFNTNVFTKYCDATTTAGRDDDGKIKTNQDTYILEKNINGVINFNIFGVLDGHGVNGHYASKFTKNYILQRIKNHPLIKNLQTPSEIYKHLTANGYQIIARIFIDADTQIAKEKFNVEMSGTTCVLVIQLGEKLICANAGDSRAILVYEDKKSFNLSDTKVYMLSYDCKPEIPIEKKRIESNGGCVSQIIDEDDGLPSGPFRVWVKGEAYPGIAISRSIGDMDAKKVGVIPNPQIIEYTLSPQSKYMIICSDGIWEYISNEEAMKFAKKYYIKNDPLNLCKDLTKKSTDLWLQDDVVVDDITVVAVFF